MLNYIFDASNNKGTDFYTLFSDVNGGDIIDHKYYKLLSIVTAKYLTKWIIIVPVYWVLSET